MNAPSPGTRVEIRGSQRLLESRASPGPCPTPYTVATTRAATWPMHSVWRHATTSMQAIHTTTEHRIVEAAACSSRSPPGIAPRAIYALPQSPYPRSATLTLPP